MRTTPFFSLLVFLIAVALFTLALSIPHPVGDYDEPSPSYEADRYALTGAVQELHGGRVNPGLARDSSTIPN